MTYEEFQHYMARYGFPSCPLTKEQFDDAAARLHEDDLFGLACDVNAGVTFEVAIVVNDRRLRPDMVGGL